MTLCLAKNIQRELNMAITIEIPKQLDSMSPLAALITHFNSSSKSVRKTFSKLVSESLAQESKEQLMLKVDAGIRDIRQGKGISKKANETTEQFFERLCTE